MSGVFLCLKISICGREREKTPSQNKEQVSARTSGKFEGNDDRLCGLEYHYRKCRIKAFPPPTQSWMRDYLRLASPTPIASATVSCYGNPSHLLQAISSVMAPQPFALPPAQPQLKPSKQQKIGPDKMLKN